MNPLSNIRNLNRINERELEFGVVGTASSWHKRYRESAWLFFGGLPYELTEGDIICVFSQFGEIVNINLVRDKKTGKSKGFGFVCYEDQRSTDLTVDNFSGMQLLGRTIRVDHVLDYRPPKDDEDEEAVIKNFLQTKGCAPEVIDEKLKLLKESNITEIIQKKVKVEKRADSDEDNDRIREAARTKIKREPGDDDNDTIRDRAGRNREHIRVKREKGSDDDNDTIRDRSRRNTEHIRVKREKDSDEDNDRIREKAREVTSKHKKHRSRSPKDSSKRHKHRY